jgi:predicted nucleic acid-binding protein
MNLLLDTSVLVDLLHGRRDRLGLVEELVEMGHRLTTSAMCVAELYAIMHPGEEERTQNLLAGLACYPVTTEIAARAGNLKREMEGRGDRVTLADMTIAATAQEHGLRLVTRRDFPLEEIVFYALP